MEKRSAVRVALFDQNGAVAIIKVAKLHYYKIPGGGVEVGESNYDAAIRETLEETGCNCKIIAELGRIETDIAGWNIHDVSDGFAALMVGERGTPSYDEWEKERGFSIEWFNDLSEAIAMISSNEVEDPDARLLQERDLEFLKRAVKVVESTHQ